MPKQAATEVFLERAEGLAHECYAVTFRGLDPLAEADRMLRRWAWTAPTRGYDKCDFRVTFGEVTSYSGRFDLQREHDSQPVLLADQMRRETEFYAGLYRPPHFTDKHWANHLREIESDDTKASALAFLEAVELPR